MLREKEKKKKIQQLQIGLTERAKFLREQVRFVGLPGDSFFSLNKRLTDT